MSDRLAQPVRVASHHPSPAPETRDTPGARQGLVVLFTGLSGAGKSTLAAALTTRLRAEGRTVTLLDGDEVRTLLSSGLGFTRADRDLNVHRIGFVAAEVARHGGTAVCAPIAPYAQARADVADAVHRAGGRFVLVHVATALAVCEERDVKGLYAKARNNEIASFTGISDPYEAPDDADLVIDTSLQSIDESLADIMAVLGAH